MDIDLDEIRLILSGVKILQDLEVNIINDIANQVKIAEFDAGQKIVSYGEQGEFLYIIFNGNVEVQVPKTGESDGQTIHLKKGSIIGEFSLLSENTKNSADVFAKVPTIALTLAKEHFLSLIKRHEAFAKQMSNLMGSRLAQNGGFNQLGKYLLTGRLGEGGMSIVFDAYDQVLEREVAIKMLKYESNYQQEFFKRFEIEAKVVARLNHPYIINVIEIIDDFSTRFIVMEKLEGATLEELLKEKGCFSIDETKMILLQLANALQYAHQQGIVHRDIKPSNIMLDEYNNIKLNDFGLAGPPQSRSKNIEGTPLYLAPEIIKSDAVDGRADIYALGVMAFHMLSARLPFYAVSLDDMLEQQVHQAAPDIAKVCPEIDEDFALFINSALEKEPDQRISDWNKINKLLQPIQEAEIPKIKDDEIGVFIRLNGATFQDTSAIVKHVEQFMSEKSLDFDIELILPSKEID